MIRPIIAVFVFIAAFGVSSATAQQPASFKNFASFRNIVPGVDFFASNRQAIAPYEKPTAERKRKKSAAIKRHYKRLRSQMLPKKMY